MTVDQHYAIARQLTLACNAVKRAWLLLGDVEGPLRPEGEALTVIREQRDKLQRDFALAFPELPNPYEQVEC